MDNWADNVDEDILYNDRGQDYSSGSDGEGGADEAYEEDAFASREEQWAHADIVQEYEVDGEGNRFEVIKKVLKYHVDREITPADLRARFPLLGKALESKQSELVSKEPPLGLELGSVDSYERESRAEVKRFIHELSNAEVSIKDPKFAIIGKHERAKQQQEEAAAAAGTSRGGTVGTVATWGASRGTAAKAAASRDEPDDVARKVRVTNISDAITEENLRKIFSDGYDESIERVFLPVDKETGKNLGFCFITFAKQSQAEAALAKGKIRFKNVVLVVSKAVRKK